MFVLAITLWHTTKIHYGTLIFLYVSNTHRPLEFYKTTTYLCHISSSSPHSCSFMDADDDIVKVTKIHSTNFIRLN